MDKKTFDEGAIKEALDTAGKNVIDNEFLFKDNVKTDPINYLIAKLTGTVYMAEYRKEALKLLGIEGEEK